jgi:hypothetical protein
MFDEMIVTEDMTDETPVQKICPECQHFYEHGKTEWEDAKECENCTRRGGNEENWKQKPKEPPAASAPA